MPLFKSFIRVVKSINGIDGSKYFCVSERSEDIVRIPVIEAKDKSAVKEYLKSEYPQFFPTGKVYEKETKDTAQFFYVVIYPLYNWEIEQINEGQWVCAQCGQVHENQYVSKPMYSRRLFGEKVLFCKSGDDNRLCLDKYIKEKFSHVDMPDDIDYIKADSPTYIYKITEKGSQKSYIGKTRNAPFFRWWNHLTKSASPFGLYLRKTQLSDWTFEVLEVLPSNIEDAEVFRIESEYIVKFNSIENGYNSLISNKDAVNKDAVKIQGVLFDNENIINLAE